MNLEERLRNHPHDIIALPRYFADREDVIHIVGDLMKKAITVQNGLDQFTKTEEIMYAIILKWYEGGS